jgi:hypothetical protein
METRVDARRPAREVAARFGVSASYEVKARQRLRDEGDAAPGPRCNRVPPRLARHEEAIRAEVARLPSATCVICALATPRCQQSRFSRDAMPAFAIYGAHSVIICAPAVARPTRGRKATMAGFVAASACRPAMHKGDASGSGAGSGKRKLPLARETSGATERIS